MRNESEAEYYRYFCSPSGIFVYGNAVCLILGARVVIYPDNIYKILRLGAACLFSPT